MKKASSGSPNTNEPTNTELRENLWESYFKNSVPPDEMGRHVGAIEMLHAIRDRLNNAGTTQEHRLNGVALALGVWSLLAAEIGAWIIEELGKSEWPLPEPDDSGKSERVKLLGMLMLQEAVGSPLHRKSLDPSTIFLPRWQALKLIDALAALDEGEVRPLFERADKGRHGEAKQWDEMRHRALEHIAFLVGQDVGKVKSRERVGKAMRVPVNTLRAWEKPANLLPLVRHQIELAKKAGKLSVVLADDPDHAKIGSGNAMDGYVAAKLEELTKEDLATFGERYSKMHGRRHNPS
jgi:hypothetical protein